jgi:Cu-Zn family superoxide dismutase
MCSLHAPKNPNLRGTVWLSADATGRQLDVVAKISGLTMESKHGFHIHTLGDISAADGAGTGGHYNPTTKIHAIPTDADRHVGDLGNIQFYDDVGDAWYHETLNIEGS